MHDRLSRLGERNLNHTVPFTKAYVVPRNSHLSCLSSYILMPARLSKRQQRELEELTHADEIEQVGQSSHDEDVQFASTSTQSAFAAVSHGSLLKIAE
jgi:hypothetical protein